MKVSYCPLNIFNSFIVVLIFTGPWIVRNRKKNGKYCRKIIYRENGEKRKNKCSRYSRILKFNQTLNIMHNEPFSIAGVSAFPPNKLQNNLRKTLQKLSNCEKTPKTYKKVWQKPIKTHFQSESRTFRFPQELILHYQFTFLYQILRVSSIPRNS